MAGQHRARYCDRQNRGYEQIGEAGAARKQRLEHCRNAKRFADDEARQREQCQRRRDPPDPWIIAVLLGNEFMHRDGAVVT
ncbi:MAG: hypothetical protein ABSC37_11575 [Xanthobacteraceae bacterium]